MGDLDWSQIEFSKRFQPMVLSATEFWQPQRPSPSEYYWQAILYAKWNPINECKPQTHHNKNPKIINHKLLSFERLDFSVPSVGKYSIESWRKPKTKDLSQLPAPANYDYTRYIQWVWFWIREPGHISIWEKNSVLVVCDHYLMVI